MERISADIIASFTYTCTEYLHHIHLPIPFPHLLPPPTAANYPRLDLFCPPVLWFCVKKEDKNDIFGCLRWLHREFSLWHFNVHIDATERRTRRETDIMKQGDGMAEQRDKT
jgi:hypothetical protein